MLIPIITAGREPDAVPPHVLDRMLVSDEIYAFYRSEGWAVVGRDPVRIGFGRQYFGPERRLSRSIRATSLTL